MSLLLTVFDQPGHFSAKPSLPRSQSSPLILPPSLSVRQQEDDEEDVFGFDEGDDSVSVLDGGGDAPTFRSPDVSRHGSNLMPALLGSSVHRGTAGGSPPSSHRGTAGGSPPRPRGTSGSTGGAGTAPSSYKSISLNCSRTCSPRQEAIEAAYASVDGSRAGGRAGSSVRGVGSDRSHTAGRAGGREGGGAAFQAQILAADGAAPAAPGVIDLPAADAAMRRRPSQSALSLSARTFAGHMGPSSPKSSPGGGGGDRSVTEPRFRHGMHPSLVEPLCEVEGPEPSPPQPQEKPTILVRRGSKQGRFKVDVKTGMQA